MDTLNSAFRKRQKFGDGDGLTIICNVTRMVQEVNMLER